MKKKFSPMHSLLLVSLSASTPLLSMEQDKSNIEQNKLTLYNNNNKHPLEESMMVTPVPTTRGLGFLRSTCDLIWDEEENLYADLLNKKFDPNNSSYPRKLDTSIEIFVSKNNNKRITETINLCYKEYHKQIKIGDSQARMSHEFLVKENRDKQLALAKVIETKDKQFIDKQNVLLDELQDTINKQLQKIHALLAIHIEERDALVKEEGEDIRRIKKALIQIHRLNKTFVLPSDGYCSDEEKNPENVNNSYNDQYLLKKINVDFSMNETKTKVERMLKALYELNQAIQDIQPLRY